MDTPDPQGPDDRATVLEDERDAAVTWIRVVSDELVAAGCPAGDRVVMLANLRRLIATRAALEDALAPLVALAPYWRALQAQTPPSAEGEAFAEALQFAADVLAGTARREDARGDA